MKNVQLPLTKNIIKTLKPGEQILLSGPVLTVRDAAHKRLVIALQSGRKLPILLKNETIYYTGPTPAKPGDIIGSCGPTTSARMDPFTPVLLKHGLIGMIGKGERSEEVTQAIKRAGAIYFITIGGAGAYLQDKIKKNEIVAYEDLGTESIRRLIVKDFPVIVSCK